MTQTMPASASLLMAIHCHQPVGNFGFVFEEAYRSAYEPFVAALERHPGIRVALHYSGPLLDWFERHEPGFVKRLAALAARGQVEFLAAGYYEPLLPLIPDADRLGQIGLMRRRLADLFGVQATGLWLTERVWEPELPASLAEAGIEYTMVDANHFRSAQAWLPAGLQVQDEFWDLFGCYSTEYTGRSVRVFPMSKRLRYWIPFQDVERTVEFLRRIARPEPVAVTYADDGEKFGLWPKTHEWVYQQGWLERFFVALEREASWVTTETFSQYLRRVGANGLVYLPCASYEEMLDWSRGYFRNFLVKYSESHAMYRKMLMLSERLAERSAATASKAKAAAGDLEGARMSLYQAQCNDSYWHGVFGGLYLANLRREVWRHLLAAERQLDPSPAWPTVTQEDQDGDGRPEVQVQTEHLGLVVAPQEQGAVTEVAYYPAGMNLADTLTRRHEPYHEKLKAKQLAAIGGGASPTSIHGALKVKEAGLEAYLAYDDHRRVWFIDHGFSVMPSLQQVSHSTWGEHRLWSWGPWTVAADGVRADTERAVVTMTRALGRGRGRKRVWLERAGEIGCELALEAAEVPVAALELNVGFQDPDRKQPRLEERVSSMTIQDPHVRLRLSIAVEPAATVVTFPIETVSDSEEGLERTMQGVAMVCLWPSQAAAWSGRLRCAVSEVAD